MSAPRNQVQYSSRVLWSLGGALLALFVAFALGAAYLFDGRAAWQFHASSAVFVLAAALSWFWIESAERERKSSQNNFAHNRAKHIQAGGKCPALLSEEVEPNERGESLSASKRSHGSRPRNARLAGLYYPPKATHAPSLHQNGMAGLVQAKALVPQTHWPALANTHQGPIHLQAMRMAGQGK